MPDHENLRAQDPVFALHVGGKMEIASRVALNGNADLSLAYTPDTVWRNRAEFLHGRDEVRAFLRRKWDRELDYRLKKELWSFTENRISVRFEYEWHDDGGQWFRSYGNEQWEFAPNGLMQRREASINDLPIRDADRKFRGEH